MEDVAGDRLEERPQPGEIGPVAADHRGHVGRAAADRGVEKDDAALAAGVGHAADHARRVGRQIDIGRPARQPCEDAGLRVEHRRRDIVRARQ